MANVLALLFKDRFFDKVVFADFIGHITLEEKSVFLKEISRIVRPGGSAVIFTPNRIGERIGDYYWRIRHILFGDKVLVTELHYGLTARSEFEPLLKECGFSFKMFYKDITRPYLARLPLVKRFLALNLLWIAKK